MSFDPSTLNYLYACQSAEQKVCFGSTLGPDGLVYVNSNLRPGDYICYTPECWSGFTAYAKCLKLLDLQPNCLYAPEYPSGAGPVVMLNDDSQVLFMHSRHDTGMAHTGVVHDSYAAWLGFAVALLRGSYDLEIQRARRDREAIDMLAAGAR